MGLFDFFKKKSPALDIESFAYKIINMDKGSVFDYDLKSWVVIDVYEYKWQSGAITVEYLIDCGTEQWYLSVDQGDEIGLSMSQRVKVRVIDPDLPDTIIRTEQPPNKIEYLGIDYLLDDESVGMFREDGNHEWADLISWEYYDRTDEHVLTIEQWGERDFEAASGKVLKEHQITNILPAPDRK